MARRNRERSAWVVSLLDLQPGDRVLEIGFGPGLGIERASELAGRGFVAGIDHSEVMLRQARKRNAAAVRAGRVELRLAGMTSIPYPDGSFAKLFAINCFQFSPDPAATLREFRRVLKPGGLAAIAIQPRSPGATEETVRQFGASLSEALAAAGFANVRVEIKPLKEISAVCALGNAPQ